MRDAQKDYNMSVLLMMKSDNVQYLGYFHILLPGESVGVLAHSPFRFYIELDIVHRRLW